MMNDIINLLNMFATKDTHNEHTKTKILQQVDDEKLREAIQQMDHKEYQIIGLFKINQDVSLKELPDFLNVSQATSSRFATDMENLGLVYKHKTELNNKEWLLTLTDLGHKLLEIKQKLDKDHQDRLATIAQDYSNEELDRFASLLRAILKMNDQ